MIKGVQIEPPMVHCIAIETSGRLGSVAVGRGADVLEVATFSAEMKHAVELMPTLDRLCRVVGIGASQIGCCYVSGGPGSFTGVRLGVTVARTLALAGGVRVVRVPTLEVIARNALDAAPSPPIVGVLLDAKRQKVYAAAFDLRDNGCMHMIAPEEWDPAEFFGRLPRSAALIGEGVQYCRAAVDDSGLRVLPESLNRARAETVYAIGYAKAMAGQSDDPRTLIPIYVRRPEAEEVWEKRRSMEQSTLQNPSSPGLTLP